MSKVLAGFGGPDKPFVLLYIDNENRRINSNAARHNKRRASY